MPTCSVKNAGTLSDTWLQKDGSWGDHKTRKKFKDQDKAEQAVKKFFGEDFPYYGIFPNS